MTAISDAQIKNIVFDIGEVLIDWNPRYLYSKIFDDAQEMEYFLSHVCNSEWNLRQDAGYDWDKAIADTTTRFPQYASQIAAYKSRWPEMVAGGVAGSVKVLQQLKAKNWPVYAITNYNHETFALSQELWPFLTLFDGIVVSGSEKICKPDLRIYEIFLDRYDVNAGECLFIDDRLENIKAAQDTGIAGLHFTSAEQMMRDLEKRLNITFD